MADRITLPYGVYDSRQCGMVHIGLYDSPDDVWQVFLGWPDESEIQAARDRGLKVLPLTVQYDPHKSDISIKTGDGDGRA